jgi:hypothetical protein
MLLLMLEKHGYRRLEPNRRTAPEPDVIFTNQHGRTEHSLMIHYSVRSRIICDLSSTTYSSSIARTDPVRHDYKTTPVLPNSECTRVPGYIGRGHTGKRAPDFFPPYNEKCQGPRYSLHSKYFFKKTS